MPVIHPIKGRQAFEELAAPELATRRFNATHEKIRLWRGWLFLPALLMIILCLCATLTADDSPEIRAGSRDFRPYAFADNQGLRIIKANGEHDRIYRQWLEVHPENRWQRWIPYFQWMLAGVAVLAALTGFLQCLVRRRTRQLALANETISAEVAERRKAEAAQQQANAILEQRTAELIAAKELAEKSLMQFRATINSMSEGLVRHRCRWEPDHHKSSVPSHTRFRSRLFSSVRCIYFAIARTLRPGWEFAFA